MYRIINSIYISIFLSLRFINIPRRTAYRVPSVRRYDGSTLGRGC
jgi:hypothetical protein